MRLRLAAALAAVFATLAFTPAQADLLIQIDKSTQQMTVSADGEQLYTWPVSTGIARYDTPNGAFTPFRKEKEHYSREWDDAPMPYSIFFTMKGHAIHGTNHSSLGHPASHGCVRLSVKNASILWGLVAKHKMANTTIVLTGTIPAGDAPACGARRAALAHGRCRSGPGRRSGRLGAGAAAGLRARRLAGVRSTARLLHPRAALLRPPARLLPLRLVTRKLLS